MVREAAARAADDGARRPARDQRPGGVGPAEGPADGPGPDEDRQGRWAWFVLGGTVVVVALVVTQLVAAWRDDSQARALLADLSASERQVLADRVVDVDEMDEALEAWVRCQEGAGFRVVAGGDTYGRSDFSRAISGSEAVRRAAEEAGTACDRENDAVEAVWFLQNDVGPAGRSAARQRLADCASGVLGTDVDAGSALSWYSDTVTGPDAWDDRTAVRTCAAEVTAATSSGFAPPGLGRLLEEADLG